MESPNDKNEARNAYKKFIKSSKGILGFSLKRRRNLKSFSEIQKEENAYNSISLGMKEVPLKKIVGSVEKFEDFDENFIPRNSVVKKRWEDIYLAYIQDRMLPPVILYKIKDYYYVYDGNHRISVAKYLNFVSIEAEVQEFLPSMDKKEEIIYRESMIMEKETGLGGIIFSDPVRYRYLKNEIADYVGKSYGNDKVPEVSEERYKLEVKKWNLNIFEPVKNIILENGLLEIYNKDNINDIFCFFLEHKYYLKKNDNNKGYSYSLINFINLIKTKEKRTLNSMCIISGKDNWDKLLNIDFMRQTEKYTGKGYEKKERNIIRGLIGKIERLPRKYKENFSDFDEGEKIFFKYISEYCRIKYGKSIYEVKKSEEIILNYIIEIFIPIMEFLGEKENILKDYEKVQNDFFFLLKNEKALISEGKDIKYEDIVSNMINFNLSGINVEKWVMNEKKEELLKNLRNRKKFREIYKEYGGIEEYSTLEYLFKWLDNMGEEGFLGKLETGIFQLKNSNELIRYKTEKVFAELKEEGNFSFIDFYVKNIENERQEKSE